MEQETLQQSGVSCKQKVACQNHCCISLRVLKQSLCYKEGALLLHEKFFLLKIEGFKDS